MFKEERVMGRRKRISRKGTPKKSNKRKFTSRFLCGRDARSFSDFVRVTAYKVVATRKGIKTVSLQLVSDQLWRIGKGDWKFFAEDCAGIVARIIPRCIGDSTDPFSDPGGKFRYTVWFAEF